MRFRMRPFFDDDSNNIVQSTTPYYKVLQTTIPYYEVLYYTQYRKLLLRYYVVLQSMVLYATKYNKEFKKKLQSPTTS